MGFAYGYGVVSGMEPQRNLLYSPEEAASVLSLGRSTMFELLSSGEIASVKIGRARRIPRVALEAYVERLQAQQSQSAA